MQIPTKSGMPRAPSRARDVPSYQQNYGETEEDYEEGFDDNVDDQGQDEMENLKLAMAREKAKA